MSSIPLNLQAVRQRIESATRAAGRLPQSVRLLAVSKMFPPEVVREAAQAGLRDFGENYVQEGVEKIRELSALGLTWHFIGPIQSNKTRLIAERFAWVHVVEREKIAARLAAARPSGMPALNVCLQVNLGAEASKGGVTPAELPALAAAVARLPRLKLRGLMCLPPEESEPARQRAWFAQLRALRDELNGDGAGLDTLSMGMSGDFEAAIEEGATVVRVGTALFGLRPTTIRTS